MDGLNALPLFLAVAEERSFSKAARRLGLSPSAAGKAVARLEARLGVVLFHRTTRRVNLTVEGELLFERARFIRDEWREAEAVLAEARAEPRGRLRVAAPAVGYRLLAPHLERFAALHPQVMLDLDFDDRSIDLVAGKVDIAIRGGPLEDSGHGSRRLGGYRFILCATPGYLAARGVPGSVRALADHAQIRFRHPGSERLQPWRLLSTADAAGSRPSHVATAMEGVLAAALAGLGIAQMPDFLAADARRAGKLVSLLDEEAPEGTFWLVWPQAAQRSPKVRAFIDFSVGRLLRAA